MDSSSPNGLNKILAAHRQWILEIVYSFFSRNQNDDSMMKPKWWSHIFFTSKPLWTFLWWFLVQMRAKKESSPQISRDMVSLHNIVSPQNGDTRGTPPPLVTPLLYHWYVYNNCTTGKYNVIKNQTLFCRRPWFKSLAAMAPPPLLFHKPLWSFFTLESTTKLWKLKLCLTAGIFLGLVIVFLL